MRNAPNDDDAAWGRLKCYSKKQKKKEIKSDEIQFFLIISSRMHRIFFGLFICIGSFCTMASEWAKRSAAEDFTLASSSSSSSSSSWLLCVVWAPASSSSLHNNFSFQGQIEPQNRPGRGHQQGASFYERGEKVESRSINNRFLRFNLNLMVRKSVRLRP